ncbi:YqgQ family protein [Paucisalibacillus sp. EB02]|uniref:YqgQ family protein n=1 Tax=Paucisalibacillus sp. EB02 TaxID=1347087 RepID=UPI0004B21979|nr:YqgQ family protein [Paucisalibacillus sp. EB02]
MKTVYDVQQILKRFGTFIYTGNRRGDMELMQSEINELFTVGVIDVEEYRLAILILRGEINKLNSEKGEK